MDEVNQQSSPPIVSQSQIPQQPDQPLVHKLHVLPMLLVGFLMLLLGLAGGYFFFAPKSSVTKNLETTKSAPTTITKPSPTVDPAVNWKAYADEENKFTFKYPPTWSYKLNGSLGPGSVYFYSANQVPDFSTQTHKGNELVVLQILPDASSHIMPTEQYDAFMSNLTINNVNIVRYHSSYQINLPNNNLLIISGNNFDSGLIKDNVAVNQVLNTFGFLDQTQATDMSNWKTYTNTKGITFKYPGEWKYNAVQPPVGYSEMVGFDKDRDKINGYAGRSSFNFMLTNSKSAIEILDEERAIPGVTESQTMIGSVRATEFRYNQGQNISVILTKNNIVTYVITGNYLGDQFNQILSTFKFTQ